MEARGSQRRRPRGSAWHWKQTDCWYFTPPGTSNRISLRDEKGNRIRGADQRMAAELALARIKLAGKWRPAIEPTINEPHLVAGICSEYIEYCQNGAKKGTVTAGHRAETVRYLNDFCSYCGELPVTQLKKGHVMHWVESHPTWQSPVTQRNAIAIVLAAFGRAQESHGLPNPLKGLKKPPPRPRLISFSPDDEQAILAATDEPFRNFVVAAIHTGLRPFCELARLTAEDVHETARGMMWKVYSTKTKKTRKIPVMARVAELVRNLLSTAPAGSGKPLFRNPKGNPWKKVTGVSRFLAIKRKLGWNQDPARKRFSCYVCRHTFAHRMLSGYWNGGAGCSIEVLAELIGDTPKVAFDHYGKEWGQHYQEPLWVAIGLPQVRNESAKRGSTGRARKGNRPASSTRPGAPT